MVANECIGAVGVAGGDGKQDKEIARAALIAVGASIVTNPPKCEADKRELIRQRSVAEK